MKNKTIALTILAIILLVLLAVLSGITYKTVKSYYASTKFLKNVLKFEQENRETVFSINKITYFSSCDANIETNSNSSFTISDLYQYTDIAIFINPNSDVLTPKNTLKSVSVDNIEFSLKPNYGTPSLYYKNINEFATSTFNLENLIENSITFNTTSEDNIDFSKPILYNNCANPITLCYVNSEIEDSFTFDTSVSNISHNGSLLKACGITLNSISCQISFTVKITNNLNELYTCPLNINIPLSTESSTIYDGSLILKDSENYIFIKQKE